MNVQGKAARSQVRLSALGCLEGVAKHLQSDSTGPDPSRSLRYSLPYTAPLSCEEAHSWTAPATC